MVFNWLKVIMIIKGHKSIIGLARSTFALNKILGVKFLINWSGN